MAEPQPNHTTTAGQSDTGPSRSSEGRAPEKTISCVSCRRRKLKCDRAKPTCSTCSRLRHECEYPERRRNMGTKRRNMKELEARLAQVETQLVGEQKAAGSRNPSITQVGVEEAEMGMEPDWDGFGMDMNIDFDDAGLADQMFDIPQYQMLEGNISYQSEPIFSQEILGLGLQEPLPPQDMMDDLFAIYFERFHPTMPIMHKTRFYASLNRAPNARPPVCLRYAMWTMASTLDEKYAPIESLLYERTRKYMQDDEMKGYGEVFISVYHAQTWGLIASYEAKKTYFSRSWMSAGRMVRLVHMLGLDRIDALTPGIKTILPPAKDITETEERRRTFWGAFYVDRWSSSGTGWPMVINEDAIRTNLPCSEYCFENGIEEATSSLQDALTQNSTTIISPFSGVIMAATLFGHNFEHMHKAGPNENPDDLQNGEFWKRHRRMDNVLSNTFMFLPDYLRLPSGISDMNVVFLNLNIHTSAICLHQAAVAMAIKHSLDPNFIKQAQFRCVAAADEITNIMRLVCHVDPAKMHSWVGFCLYLAAGIYVKNQKSDHYLAQALPNLDFLLSAMRAIGRKHSITRHFTVQLELDIDGAGLAKKQAPGDPQSTKIPNLPINGLLVDRRGLPMTLEDIQGYHNHGSCSSSERIAAVTPDSGNENNTSSPDDNNNKDTNDAVKPVDYFPGAISGTQWAASTGFVEAVQRNQSARMGEVETGSRSARTVDSLPHGIQPFIIQGINTMTLNKDRGQRPEDGSANPFNNTNANQTSDMDDNAPGFNLNMDQIDPLTGGRCPWADADPAVVSEWQQRNGFVDSNNQELNPGVGTENGSASEMLFENDGSGGSGLLYGMDEGWMINIRS